MMKKVKLSEIVRVQIGRTPSRSVIEYWGIGHDWLTISDLNHLEEGKYVVKSEEQITDTGVKEAGCIEIKPNTVLYSFKLSIGKVCITRKSFYTNEAIAALIIQDSNKITPDFLFYALKTLKTSGFEDQGAKGFALTKSTLSALLIPIFEIKQQNRIVATLDKIQSLIDKRKKTIVLLDELVKAMFLDIFGDPLNNPKGHRIVKLKDLGKWQCGGTPLRSQTEYFTGDIPWYSSGELNEIYISNSNEKITERALQKTSTKKIQKGSLLLGMYDTAALKSSITTVDAACNQAIAFAKLDEKICSTEYVYYAIQLNKVRYLNQRRGARQQNLNLSSIENIEIPLPNPPSQYEFVEKTIVFSQYKSKLKVSLQNLETLFQSILQDVFNEKEVLKEEDLFEDLVTTFTKEDYKKNVKRILYLLNSLNQNKFKDYDAYEVAQKMSFEMLEEKLIEQIFDSSTHKLELKELQNR